MSIINEALKKTQTLRQTPSPVANDRPSPPQETWPESRAVPSVPRSISLPAQSSSVPAKPRQRKWHIIVLLEILFLLFVVGVLFIVQPQFSGVFPKINLNAGTDKKTPPQQPPPAVRTAPATISTAAPSPAASHRHNRGLIVNGIMMNNGKIAALINGEIYETGDYIDGKKITDITGDEVILMDKNEVTVLSVRRASR